MFSVIFNVIKVYSKNARRTIGAKDYKFCRFLGGVVGSSFGQSCWFVDFLQTTLRVTSQVALEITIQVILQVVLENYLRDKLQVTLTTVLKVILHVSFGIALDVTLWRTNCGSLCQSPSYG